jgi:hypothetical protein
MTNLLPIRPSTLIKRTILDDPLMGTDWYFNKITDWNSVLPTIEPFDENSVFHAELEHSSADYTDDTPWKIRIGKGGQLYSIVVPELGECIPPQYRGATGIRGFVAPWCDDCFLPTLHSKHLHAQDNYIGLNNDTFSNGFIHGAGMYARPYLDVLNNKPFFSPLLSEKYNEQEKSYSLINIGVVPCPSVNRGDILIYTKYRDLGAGVIEITHYFYNFGTATYTYLDFPWSMYRASKLPIKLMGRNNNTYNQTVNDSIYFLDGYKTELSDGSKFGGWVARTQDKSNPNSFTIGHVQGTDKHGSEQFSLSNSDEEKWQYARSIGRGMSGDIGGNRDFATSTTAGFILLKPGRGFFSKCFLVLGKLKNVPKKCSALVDYVDYGCKEFPEKSIGKYPLYNVLIDGQRTLSSIQRMPTDPIVGHSLAIPERNAIPLFLLKNTVSGNYSISTDHYSFCGKKPFENPYPTTHENYQRFQNKHIYQIYDGKTEWIELLGFALELQDNQLPPGFQKLSDVIQNISFEPGEKYSADQLMIYA